MSIFGEWNNNYDIFETKNRNDIKEERWTRINIFFCILLNESSITNIKIIKIIIDNKCLQ